jgi:deferrochelatase/peroxidase EfeB
MSSCPVSGRRGFLGGLAAGMAASVSAASAGTTSNAKAGDAGGASADPGASAYAGSEPFYGAHQGGIATPPQAHTYFATFDLTTDKRDDLRALLQRWSKAAAGMAAGNPAGPADSDEVLGMEPARLTLTFGLGPGVFIYEGQDRFGLAKMRPPALVDLPIFVGDQLQGPRTGGDLSVQACANDPQIAFHAVRQLAALAYDTAKLRWAQSGFLPHVIGQTPRNLMGFRDGTSNPSPKNPQEMAAFVWAGNDGPAWMQGGSYLVARRIRIALEHWDRTPVAFQETTVGRTKISGAPIGGKTEFELAKLDATDADGNPIIAENAHVRLATAASNGGARILRRGYSYNDGLSFTAERWPPWRQGMEYDAGLLFMAYQRDPRTGFIKIFERMAKFDMLNQFVTHTGSGIFACPPGCSEGGFVGEGLFT